MDLSSISQHDIEEDAYKVVQKKGMLFVPPHRVMNDGGRHFYTLFLLVKNCFNMWGWILKKWTQVQMETDSYALIFKIIL